MNYGSAILISTRASILEERRFAPQDRPAFRAFMQGLANPQPKESTLILRLAGEGQKRVALQPLVLAGAGEVFAKVSGLEISVPERAYETLKRVFGITASELSTIRDMMAGMSGAEMARVREIAKTRSRSRSAPYGRRPAPMDAPR